MISCVMAFVGFIFVLYSFAYQVFDLGYSSHNVSLEEDYKVLQYEIIIKWRQLEGIVNDISLNSMVNTSYSVIQFLIKNHFINNEESNVLKKFLEIINKIVHSMDDNYTTEELKTMINKIDKIIIKLNKIV